MAGEPDVTNGWRGQRLGRYEVLGRLATGGMGEVLLAREHGIAGFDRVVVIKRLLPHLADSPHVAGMFVDEARIAGQLTHPNIVQVYELGEAHGSYFMAMEYVPGPSVSALMRRLVSERQTLPRELAVHIVHEVARALDYAHNARDTSGRPLAIVHRDVSPQNVLVSARGDVKLMDFGVARAAISQVRTRTGAIRGKLAYMAPEQVHAGPLDARTDVFAAGILLYELTLGRRLFHGKSDAETVHRVASEPIVRPILIDPSYPHALDELVMAALERDPDRRLGSAAALADGLREILQAVLPAVDPRQLGQLVTTLFPESVAPATADAFATTAPDAAPAPAATRPSRPARADPADEVPSPASPVCRDRTDEPPTTPATPAARGQPDRQPLPPDAPGPAPTRRRRLALLGVLALLLGAGGGAMIALVPGDGDERVAPAPRLAPVQVTDAPDPASTSDLTRADHAPVDAGAPAVRPAIDAAPPVVAAADGPEIEPASARRKRRTARPLPAQPDERVAPPHAAAQPGEPTAPGAGVARTGPETADRERTGADWSTKPTTDEPRAHLAIGSAEGAYEIYLDGAAQGTVPRNMWPPPGRYRLELVGWNGQRLTGMITLKAGKTTMCRIAGGNVGCSQLGPP